MAEPRTLARPYARAAFESARHTSSLLEWSDCLGVFAAISLNPKILVELNNPALSAAKQVEVLVNVFGEPVPGRVSNFLSILSLNRRLPLLPAVYKLFEEYKASFEKVIDVDMYTAFEVDEKLYLRISDGLANQLDREVNIRQHFDPALIGGVLIRAGDTVIDGSVKGRLAMLAEAMEQ